MAEVACRQFDVLGKATVDLPADHTRLMLTQIVAPAIAPAAVAADQIVVHIHPVPGLEAVDIRTDLRHVTGDFVADDTGQLATPATAAVAVPDQGQAEAAGADLYQDLAGTRLRHRHVFRHEWPA